VADSVFTREPVSKVRRNALSYHMQPVMRGSKAVVDKCATTVEKVERRNELLLHIQLDMRGSEAV
jgi:hypothetical protein